jgi:hypothetical protein
MSPNAAQDFLAQAASDSTAEFQMSVAQALQLEAIQKWAPDSVSKSPMSAQRADAIQRQLSGIRKVLGEAHYARYSRILEEKLERLIMSRYG